MVLQAKRLSLSHSLFFLIIDIGHIVCRSFTVPSCSQRFECIAPFLP